MRAGDIELSQVRRIAARALSADWLVVERAESGASTPVYRIRRGREVFYLRLAENREASLAPEALAHGLLRGRGVRVPEVIFFEPFDEAIERAVMVTTAIPGGPIGRQDEGVDLRAVLIEAGRDLAAINDLAVAGFGWIRRDRRIATRLEAEYASLRAFADDGFEEHLERLRGVLTDGEVREIGRVVADRATWLDVEEARLVHGDLDAAHIFAANGRYTGIIDVGEMRGADRWYDLGHVALHDGETLPAPLLADLLEGYRDVAPLPADHAQRIGLWSVLIGVRALARQLDRPSGPYRDHLVGAIRRSLRGLGGSSSPG